MQFDGDETTLSTLRVKFVAADGTLTNLAAATIAALLLRRRRERADAGEFFLWLFATVNLLQAGRREFLCETRRGSVLRGVLGQNAPEDEAPAPHTGR